MLKGHCLLIDIKVFESDTLLGVVLGYLLDSMPAEGLIVGLGEYPTDAPCQIFRMTTLSSVFLGLMPSA